MKYFPYYVGIALVLVLGFAVMSGQLGSGEAQEVAVDDSPAHLEKSETGGLPRVLFSERAIARTGVETLSISNTAIVPYAALIYDTHGQTWIYEEIEHGTYMRMQVSVVRINGNQVFLKEKISGERDIVITGTLEIYGFENGVGGSKH